MVRDMRATVAEQRELEEALKTRAVLHDEELSKLYEEMEAQLDMERQRVKRQEQDREQKVGQNIQKRGRGLFKYTGQYSHMNNLV